MSGRKTLQGTAKGSVSADDLMKYAEKLSGEIVTLANGQAKAAVSIIERWSFDPELEEFSFEFSQQALDYLEQTNDPRLEVVQTLFAEIE